MSCSTGIVRNYECDDETFYPVPGGGASMFYTTWSWWACMASLGLLVVYLVLICFSKNRQVSRLLTTYLFQLFVIALIAMPAINSVGVLGASQLLLAKNFKLSDRDTHKPPTHATGMTSQFFQSIQNVNFFAHILPGMLAIGILLGLSFGRQSRSSRSWQQNLGLAAMILCLNLVFVMIWMAIPTEKGHTWIEKVKEVYNDPPGWIFGIQAGIVLLLIFLVSFKVA